MIFNPFFTIPKSEKSHVRGWTEHWSECIDEPIASKDSLLKGDLYIDHGVNFGGNLNLFGGVTSDITDKLKQLAASQGKLYSLDIDMPAYAGMLAKRGVIIPGLEAKLASAITLKQSDLDLPYCVYGDSHATAYAPSKSKVLRNNGQTLFGALRDNKIPHDVDLIVLGSVDIRHHIHRQENPMESIVELASALSEFAFDIAVGIPVPIEKEDRKIPKTGFYKGEPFSGSRSERLAYTMAFKQIMEANRIAYVMPPNEWYECDNFDYMELASSVHIAPTHYRRKGGWNVFDNY